MTKLRIAVVGAGRMGAALTKRWRDAGHRVTICFSRDPDRLAARARQLRVASAPVATAVADAEVVLLAVPWEVLPGALEELGGLADKIVIDCVNPIDRGELALGWTTSAAEEIAGHVPSAHVVKAFNVLSANALASPDPNRFLVFYCGNNARALEVVRRLIEDAGFVPVECGPLMNARYLEPFAMLCIRLSHSPAAARSTRTTGPDTPPITTRSTSELDGRPRRS